jgi:hypothetical protein
MKIGIFASRFGMGGSQNTCLSFCDQLSRRGHDITLYCPAQDMHSSGGTSSNNPHAWPSPPHARPAGRAARRFATGKREAERRRTHNRVDGSRQGTAQGRADRRGRG